MVIAYVGIRSILHFYVKQTGFSQRGEKLELLIHNRIDELGLYHRTNPSFHHNREARRRQAPYLGDIGAPQREERDGVSLFS